MPFNFERSYVVSDDGVAIESGVHIQSGSGVPVHAVTNASVYFRTNGEIYTNDISGWVLFAGSSTSTTFKCVKFYDSAQLIPAVTENLFEAEVSGGTISLNPLKEQVI